MKSAFIVACVLALAAGCRRGATEHEASKSAARPMAEATPFVIDQNTKWKTVEEFAYARDPALPPMHFKLELPEGYNDPGDFIRMHIQVAGHPDLVLDNDDGWVDYSSADNPSQVYAHLATRNLVQSKRVLVLSASRRKNDPPLVFLRSWGYASNAERLHVIGFESNGKPIVLLNKELDLIELTDLDGDGYSEIVGEPCPSQGFGRDLATYDPLHVYKIPHPVTGPAVLSMRLSKSYNLKHYYGWAGPHCSEHLAVVLHPPGGGKPVIMKTEEAERLSEQETKHSTK